MLKCRNALAHDYDGEYAMTVFSRIITEYYSLFEKLKNTLESSGLPEKLRIARPQLQVSSKTNTFWKYNRYSPAGRQEADFTVTI